MTPLRQQMIDAMLMRGFSDRTHQSYLAVIKQLAGYYHRSPDGLSVAELQGYFMHLVKDRTLNNLGWKLFNALFPRTLESFARFLPHGDCRAVESSPR